MTITNFHALEQAISQRSISFTVNKASIATQIAGGFSSLWRATGLPTAGAVPTSTVVCNNLTSGAFNFNNAEVGAFTYFYRATLTSGNNATDNYFVDRLLHMGGLNGTLTTAQTVSADASVAGLDIRRGDAGYSDVQWWLEWYTATGSTVSNGVTITYTNTSDVSGRTTTVNIPASTGAGRMIPIIGAAGEFIKSIQSVTLAVSTGTAGNFGVTATRNLCSMALGLANTPVIYDWQLLGLPALPENTCLSIISIPGTTSTGTLNGIIKLTQG